MDNQVSLRDRVVMLAGPFNSVTQNLIQGLTQFGADVVLVDREAQAAQKFCQNVNDQREINEKFGRSMAINCDLSQAKSMRDASGQIAQSFGSLDIYIDANFSSPPSPMNFSGEELNLHDQFTKNLWTPLQLTQIILPFAKGRKRGRILYLVNKAAITGSEQDAISGTFRSGLLTLVKSLAPKLLEFHTTINLVSLGLTEEYLLSHYPQSPSIKDSLEKLREHQPQLRLTEPDRILNSIAFLLSQMGMGITGQLIDIV